MPRGKPVDLGIVDFPNQRTAHAHFKEMLNRHDLGDDVTRQDRDELYALLRRHPEAVTKIGLGVERFFVDKAYMGTRCFWIERIDGSTTDFSYSSCVSGKAPTIDQEFAQACRVAVDPDLREAKRRYFDTHADDAGRVKCAVTGEFLTIDEAHIDHKPPMTFEVIVNTFRSSHPEIVPDYDIITPPADSQFVPQFTDDAVRDAFRSYHHNIAEQGNLQIVTARTNLSSGPKHRVRPAKLPVKIPGQGSLFDLRRGAGSD